MKNHPNFTKSLLLQELLLLAVSVSVHFITHTDTFFKHITILTHTYAKINTDKYVRLNLAYIISPLWTERAAKTPG